MAAVIIQKWGNSQGVRIPKSILDAAKMRTDETVEIELEGDRIVIRKAEPGKKTIRELFAGYHGTDECGEIDWGEPAGDEVW